MIRNTRARTSLLVGAALIAGTGVALAALAPSIAGAAPTARISLTLIGTHATGQFDESAAEIVAHDPDTQQLFVVNAQKGAIDVLDISDPTAPTPSDPVGTIVAAGPVNSVAVRDGVIAVAVEADPKQNPGWVQFFEIDGVGDFSEAATVEVGALPDMLTFTPDGTKVVVANEGEPDGYCTPGIAGDPKGSISIIDVSGGVENLNTVDDVENADFTSFNGQIDELRAAGVRIFGPNASVAQDLEPEYVAIDADSTTAWVALQENNALAIVDLDTATVTDIAPLGFKDHSAAGNALDPSDRDSGIAIANWPVMGMYMPDGMDAYEFGNRTYLVTANEGDAREYECYEEEARIKELVLDDTVFPDAAVLQQDANLGRLNSTTSFDTTGLPATELYSFGARSFSIWDEAGGLVFDSGDEFEQITTQLIPDDFNSDNDENDSFDSRSDAKGPEPEGIEIAEVFSKTYAFIGLERVGGIMVYDITTPRNPKFVEYVNNRDFSIEDPADPAAGDLGPEGLTFIAPVDSPNGRPLLVVANEVSGTTTIFQIDGPGRQR